MVQPALIGAGAAIIGFILGKNGKQIPVYAKEPLVPRFWSHGQVPIPLSGTPVSFPSMRIPEGMELLIVAWPENTGTITLGTNKDETADALRCFWGLAAGQGLSLDIADTDTLWVNSTENEEGVSFIVRRKSGGYSFGTTGGMVL